MCAARAATPQIARFVALCARPPYAAAMTRISALRLAFAALAFAMAPFQAQASDAIPRHDGADGGNGLPNGIPGCAGGTDPSPDGKFYIPGTRRECNPGKQDRAKVR